MTDQTDTAVPDSATDKPGMDEAAKPGAAKETGGPKEANPTRYGDWTVKGRCIDF